MNRSEILRRGLILLFLSVLFFPLAGAVPQRSDQSGSQNYLNQDSAELISPLKMHIAYVGKTQQARMDGVISYIDNYKRWDRNSRPATDTGRLPDCRVSVARDAHC